MRRNHRILAIAMILFASQIGLFARAADEITDEKAMNLRRLQLVRKLYSENFFKNASCADVVNTNLRRLGLPGIEEKTRVKGERLKADRDGQKRSIPELSDGLITPGSEPTTIRVESHQLSPMRMRLTIDRSMKSASGRKPLALKTTYLFDVDKTSGTQICEMAQVTFDLEPAVGHRAKGAEGGQITTGDCIDLFMVRDKSIPEDVAKEPMSLRWLQEDCAIGLHYSKAAKALLKN